MSLGLSQVVSLLAGLTSDLLPQTGLLSNPIPQVPQTNVNPSQIPPQTGAYPNQPPYPGPLGQPNPSPYQIPQTGASPYQTSWNQVPYPNPYQVPPYQTPWNQGQSPQTNPNSYQIPQTGAGVILSQTAEELLETIRKDFSRAAFLNNIDITSISYDRFDEIYFKGPSYIETFDFIIVGGGSAGAVLANRLSEVPKFKILLLEAGEVGDFLTDLPGITSLQQFSQYTWNFLTEDQSDMALGLKNQKMRWSKGKGLGGSSLTNYMEYIRGGKVDYDAWGSSGNPGWSYEDVLPYFKRSEDSRLKLEDASKRHRGGELTVEDVAYRSESARCFVEACRSLGYSYVDYNGAHQIGVSYVQATTRKGLRCSAEKAFLRPARDRPNLTIRTGSYVTKVLIDEGNVAYGVEYLRNGVKYVVNASKEVVLSAGAIKTPQLLILSGVGPRFDLAELGLEVRSDLPVGKKLYDHLAYMGLTYKLNWKANINESAWFDSSSFVEVHQYGRGPLTSTGGAEALTFIATDASQGQNPSVGLIFLGLGLSTDNGVILSRYLHIADGYYDAIFKHLEQQPVVTVTPILLHPKSSGYLKVHSTNPLDHPKLHGNYFTDPEGQDVKTLIAGIREAQRIFRTPAFQKLGAEQNAAVVPGCELFDFDSDPYLECALRSLSVSAFEVIGTCKMGPASDPDAIVDPNLRVYGIQNLRVIDASVIPIPISGHGNAPALMIAEKGADIIKQKWGWTF